MFAPLFYLTLIIQLSVPPTFEVVPVGILPNLREFFYRSSLPYFTEACSYQADCNHPNAGTETCPACEAQQ